jgi:hypothetical protein
MAEQYYGRQRSYGSLVADIEDFVRVSEERMLAIARSSIRDVVNEAQLEGPSKTGPGFGGKMRVDTGFLRSTGLPSLQGFPSGPSRGELKAPNSYTYNSDKLDTILAQMKFGDTFFFGWTAHYARYRELYDGFLEGAVQHWGRIVAINTDTLRERIK